jgi:hypothetical protein
MEPRRVQLSLLTGYVAPVPTHQRVLASAVAQSLVADAVGGVMFTCFFLVGRWLPTVEGLRNMLQIPRWPGVEHHVIE